MSIFKLFIAATLDGYIARPDGAIDFLNEIPEVEGQDFGYGEFISGVDILVMGRKTYEEVLSFGEDWPYGGLRTIILSSQGTTIDSPDTQIWPELNAETIQQLRMESKRGVWIVGGGAVIKGFLNLHAVDEIILSIVPRIIGSGIPLFPEGSLETQFELVGTEAFANGLANLVYRKKN